MCGAQLEEVLFTTGTPAGDPLTWRAWPLVLDGWRCTRCDEVQVPRFLEPDESVAIAKAAAEAAGAGREDEAEFGFRRIVASWSRYRPGLVDLSTLLMARATRLDLDGKTDLALLDEIEENLREALDLDPPPSREHVVGMLAQVLLMREQVVQAQNLLCEELGRPELDPGARQQLEETVGWITLRGDLYDRGAKLVPVDLMQLHGKPRPVLDEHARQRVQRGVDYLVRHQQANPTSWQALWLAAMATKTLSGDAASLKWFARLRDRT